MTGEAIIAKLTDLREIPGADRIVQSTIFGETVIVSKTVETGSIGILFDCETQLSHAYCQENNMYRHGHLNKDPEVTGYMEDNRRVRPVTLKGVRCSGLWMPIESLTYSCGTANLPKEIGNQFTEWNDHSICAKYVSPKTQQALNRGNKGGKAKINKTPTFKEHIDTSQFMRNLHRVTPGSTLIITEKLHGTSCRVANLQTITTVSKWQQFCSGVCMLFITGRFKKHKTYKSYNHIVGSRRVVKQAGGKEVENKASYYKADVWSESAERFKGKMLKGETAYYEIVGYTPDGASIMTSQTNEKLKKFMSKSEYKAFIEKYGNTTHFTYGVTASEGNSPGYGVYVYRMTTTNEDGDSVDYSWDQVKMRCEQMGVDHVPELGSFNIPMVPVEGAIEKAVDSMAEEDSYLFPQQLREGVVVRIDGPTMTPTFLKQKSYLFKVLEGIIKDSDVVDLEEAEG